MRRYAVGMAALGMLLGAGILQWTSSEHEGLAGGLVRAGAVLATVWLAYDALQRIPLISLIGVPLLILVVVFSRAAKWLILIIPLVLILALLWPRVQGKKQG